MSHGWVSFGVSVPPNDVVATTTRTPRRGCHNDVVAAALSLSPLAGSLQKKDTYVPSVPRARAREKVGERIDTSNDTYVGATANLTFP